MYEAIFTGKNFLVIVLVLFSNSLQAQTADFSYSGNNNSFCAPYTTTFTQQCSGNPIGFIWNFGNGEKSADPVEQITFNNAGTFTITLTALYSNVAVSVKKTITILPSPVVALSADKTVLCNPGAVTFAASGGNATNGYQWDFGDSSAVQNTTANTVTYNYSSYGNFTVNVKAAGESGCSGYGTYTMPIYRFDASTTVTNDTGCVPAAAVLIVSANLPAGDRPLSYTWNFGDASPPLTGADSSAGHLYNTTDTITNASVQITSALGCNNTFSFSAFAYGTPPSNTSLATATLRDTFCGSEIIQFNCRALNANAYLWDFGDSVQQQTTDTFTTHEYRSTGRQRVTVTPLLNGCPGQQDSMDIFINGVIAAYSYSNTCEAKNNFQFQNTSKGNITAFTWTFSDAPNMGDSTNVDAAHLFPASGSFTTTLFLRDSSTGCADTLATNIYTARPELTASISTVCRDSLISYRVINSFPDSAGYTYLFYVNRDTVPNGGNASLDFYPPRTGNFADQVMIADAVEGTCDDTLMLSGGMLVRGPFANFTGSTRQCADKLFNFSDTSIPFRATDQIAKWEWDFEDSTKSAQQNPAPHRFAAGGYNVRLKVTDINGCANERRRFVIADKLPQVIAFPAADTICQSKDTATLTGYTIDSLLWLPESNISCTGCDTTNVYPAQTTAYIAQATGRFGCTSYDTCFVKVLAPFDLEVFPADTTVCPQKPVQYDLSVNGITEWTPSVSLNSNIIKQPIATVTNDITYTVSVRDSLGCYADTATAAIHVYPAATADAGPDLVVPYNSSFTINPVYAPGVQSYLWEPATGLSCTNCAAPSGIAVKTTTYNLTTISAAGCVSEEQVTIFIACENGNLLLPTAFSPNGNGVNEYFYPVAKGYKTIKRFVIFNRRGNKVFEKQNFLPNDPASGWNGIIKGAETVTSTETFVWYIEAECEQGQLVTNKGTVVLVK